MPVGTVGAGEPILDPITAFGATQLHLPGGSKSHLLYGGQVRGQRGGGAMQKPNCLPTALALKLNHQRPAPPQIGYSTLTWNLHRTYFFFFWIFLLPGAVHA